MEETNTRNNVEASIFQLGYHYSNDKLTVGLWNDYYRDALRVIRETNPQRCVLLGVAEWGGISALKSLTIVPNDNHLILTIHYYNPFQFTHQGAE